MSRGAVPGKAYVAVACTALVLLLAQVVGHSWHRTGYRWYASDVPVHMRLITRSPWTNAAIDALRAWNSAGARFQFSWGQYSSGSESCSGSNSRNDVIWSYTACRAWGDNTVARAHYWFRSRSGQLLDADVVFNLNKSWDIYYGRRRSGVLDFRRVAIHEFGHVLGLDHPDDIGQRRTAVMNSQISDTDRLQSDDIDGIRAIYGSDLPRGTPDLVVRSVQTSPRTPTAGGTFTLSASVRNVGNGTSAATTLRYYYYRSSSLDWVVVGTDSVPGLSPSGSSQESIRLTAPSSAGTHYFNACVAAVRGESNTSNCSDNLQVTVTGGETPDLVVESARATPATLAGGEVFTLSASVRNVGNGTSAATTLRYYYYQSSSLDWVVLGTASVGSLSPSSSSPESTIRLTAPSSAGTYFFNVCVASVAGERNTSNCSDNLQVTVTVTGGGTPDLVVESARATPATLAGGEVFTLSASVRNVGNGTSAATTLRYYYYRSSSLDWVVLGTASVGSLSPSSSSPESIRLTAPSSAGTYFFNVCVASVAGERNTSNCSGNLRVTVQ